MERFYGMRRRKMAQRHRFEKLSILIKSDDKNAIKIGFTEFKDNFTFFQKMWQKTRIERKD